MTCSYPPSGWKAGTVRLRTGSVWQFSRLFSYPHLPVGAFFGLSPLSTVLRGIVQDFVKNGGLPLEKRLFFRKSRGKSPLFGGYARYPPVIHRLSTSCPHPFSPRFKAMRTIPRNWGDSLRAFPLCILVIPALSPEKYIPGKGNAAHNPPWGITRISPLAMEDWIQPGRGYSLRALHNLLKLSTIVPIGDNFPFLGVPKSYPPKTRG